MRRCVICGMPPVGNAFYLDESEPEDCICKICMDEEKKKLIGVMNETLFDYFWNWIYDNYYEGDYEP